MVDWVLPNYTSFSKTVYIKSKTSRFRMCQTHSLLYGGMDTLAFYPCFTLLYTTNKLEVKHVVHKWSGCVVYCMELPNQ